jgi:hypothetical protein
MSSGPVVRRADYSAAHTGGLLAGGGHGAKAELLQGRQTHMASGILGAGV